MLQFHCLHAAAFEAKTIVAHCGCAPSLVSKAL